MNESDLSTVHRKRDLLRNLDFRWGTLSAGEPPIPGSSRLARADDLLTTRGMSWTKRLAEAWHPHRKLWEWVYILDTAHEHGVLRPGAVALCFGVGREPIPSLLAAEGVAVLATDQPTGELSEFWAASGQFAAKLEDIHRDAVVNLDTFLARVTYRPVDMNELPEDLPKVDFIWSSCTLEHLGTPEAGIEFLLNTLDLLEPGGVSVHTTELDLVWREKSIDLGHCAIYQRSDMIRLQAAVLERGFHMVVDPRLPVARAEDVHISLPPYDEKEPHFKLEIGATVTTSFGITISRPIR
jgi:hypothetical protein